MSVRIQCLHLYVLLDMPGLSMLWRTGGVACILCGSTCKSDQHTFAHIYATFGTTIAKVRLTIVTYMQHIYYEPPPVLGKVGGAYF